MQTQACHFIKKDTLAQVFSLKFSEISHNTFLTEYLWATASISRSSVFYLSSPVFLGGYFLRAWMTNLWLLLKYGLLCHGCKAFNTHDLHGRQVLLKFSFVFIYLILKQGAGYILQEIQTGHWVKLSMPNFSNSACLYWISRRIKPIDVSLILLTFCHNN